MGRAIVRLAKEAGDVEIACAIGASDVGADVGELAGVGKIGVAIVSDVAALAGARADVVIDFSAAPAVAQIVNTASRAGVAIVSGTTGLADDAKAALDDAAKRVAVLWEPNMSVGVHVLADLVRRAVLALGDGYDIEIVEAHHRAKVDAPSGTAKRLADVAAAARNDTRFVHGREGRPGPRAKQEIGIHAVRGGDVIGDHTVHLFGGGERIELVHRATSRDVFAHGALRAARWIAGKPAGRYALADVLA
jgi:4-hydroxy-tetrahydrodipicolinate reductase